MTIRTTVGMPPHLHGLDPEPAGLPALGSVDLMLHTAEAMPLAPVFRLRDMLITPC